MSEGQAVVGELEEGSREVGPTEALDEGDEERGFDLLLLGRFGVSSDSRKSPVLGKSLSEDVCLIRRVDLMSDERRKGEFSSTRFDASEGLEKRR